MAKKNSTDELNELRERLFRRERLAWEAMDDKERAECLDYADDYKEFITRAKTERETVSEIEARARAAGFAKLGKAKKAKVYSMFRGKVAAVIHLGKKPITEGLRIVSAHLDTPHLDLKQNPLYEEVGLAMLKTHYYGGIKKYQWLARPLALHGKVFLKDGSSVTLRLGEEKGDPVFTVADLLPHLSAKQYEKKVADAFEAEKLNLMAASLPLGDEEVKERVKLGVMNLLHEKYGITEEDFTSAELQAVPAGPAVDLGFDRSMVAGYGQDDRACVFAALHAILNLKKRPQKTAIALFFDKEETGSQGATGADSRYIEWLIHDLMEASKEPIDPRAVSRTLMNTHALAADVTGALDPDYQEVHEKRNAAKLGYGIAIAKHTGHRGKYNTSDASAEFVSKIRALFDEKGVVWQPGAMGKVDEGGGGTIAKFLATYGMEVLDAGPALLSVHSPLEIASKADLYMSARSYAEFFAADKL